jgi:hypothetical protein
MMWTVELSDEVQAWYDRVPDGDLPTVDDAIMRLATLGNAIRMPDSRPLGSGLFELRFDCGRIAQRITYAFDPDRRIITLTTFRKTRDNERREVARARRALNARRQGEEND